MTPSEAAAILRAFNAWRRGESEDATQDPKLIGEAMDVAAYYIEEREDDQQ